MIADTHAVEFYLSIFRIALTIALFTLPGAAIADTVALAGEAPAVRPCTLTMNFVPKTLPPSPDAEPVIFVNTTQSYPIKSFTLKRPLRPRSASVATVTADLDLESTVAALLDQHAIIERAELSCPTKNATLTNATIGYIGMSSAAHARVLSFEMNFWPKNVEFRR